MNVADREICGVLCTARYRRELRERLEQALAPAPVFWLDPQDYNGIRSVLDRVDVAVLDNDLDSLILEARGLRWIHCCHAGLDKSARPEVFRRGILLTGVAGRSSASLAEHVFFFALGHVYDVYRLHREQQVHGWHPMAERYTAGRGLSGQTMGIVGLGNTGLAVAARAKAFEMEVLGCARSQRRSPPPHVDRCFSTEAGEGLEPLLRESDFVALCCRLTDETHHLIGRGELSMMKPTAMLINVSRGAVVDEVALADALGRGAIAGAASDVFETEPLPDHSPLWDLPGMMITPHATPRVADIQGNSLDILMENIRRYRLGEPLRNRLTQRDVYTKGQGRHAQ